MSSTKMVEAVKGYKAALRVLRATERANAGAEDLRPVNVKRATLAREEERMVLAMVAELSKAEPTRSDELYALFNRARGSAVYWPKIVASALAYGESTVALEKSLARVVEDVRRTRPA